MLSNAEIALRLLLAVVAGGVIGYERESHGRAAGLRTTLLVCAAAAIAMMLSDYLLLRGVRADAWRPDPARLAQGILAGMGFLGAGAIVREGNLVRGVTTAAVLWIVTVLGLAFGSGHLFLGTIGWAVTLTALFVLPRVEARIPNDWYGAVSVTLSSSNPDDSAVRRHIEESGALVKGVSYDDDLVGGTCIVRYQLKYKKRDLLSLSQRIHGSLSRVEGVRRITWH